MKGISKEKIFDLLRENKIQLQKYQVKQIGLFGSLLRGDNNESSDVDFLVVFQDGKKSFDNFMGAAMFLEEILEKKVDLLTIEALSPHMREKILKEAQFETI